MKKAIYTIKIGTNPNWDLCIKSQEAYAKKHNIDYIILTDRRVNWPYGPNPVANFYFEKLQVVSLFQLQKYDQILYMDSDILITPHARNIFEVYPKIDTYYGFDESMNVGITGPTMFGGVADIMDRDPYVESVLPYLLRWNKNSRKKYIYYNMGVMLMGKDMMQKFASYSNLIDLARIPRIYDFNDQTFFNAMIQHYNIPNEGIEHSFNRMHLGLPDVSNERYKADFIHYAGPCLYGIKGEYSEEGKRQAVITDYNHFYASQPV